MRVYGIDIRTYTVIDDDDLDISMSQLVGEFPKCLSFVMQCVMNKRRKK